MICPNCKNNIPDYSEVCPICNRYTYKDGRGYETGNNQQNCPPQWDNSQQFYNSQYAQQPDNYIRKYSDDVTSLFILTAAGLGTFILGTLTQFIIFFIASIVLLIISQVKNKKTRRPLSYNLPHNTETAEKADNLKRTAGILNTVGIIFNSVFLILKIIFYILLITGIFFEFEIFEDIAEDAFDIISNISY